MKKLLVVLLSLSVLLLVSCGGKEKADRNKLEKIKDKGEIVISVSPDYPPMEFIDKDNNVVGSDIELAKYIAEKLGVELKIETMDFSAALTAVDFDKADIGVSGFGWTKEREENYDLSNTYNVEQGSESTCNAILIREEDKDTLKTLEDFEGKKLAAQANSIQEEIATKQTKATIEKVSTIDQGILELTSKKVDGITLSCVVADGYAKSVDGLVVSEAPLETDTSKIGNVVVIRKGDTELLEEINKIIDEVNEKKLYVKWYDDAVEKAKEEGIDLGE